jgi:hypothetical protein
MATERYVSIPPLRFRPDAIGMAAAPGEVWIIEPDGVIQVHPAKGIHRTIPLPGRPTTIEIDAELGVWIGGRGPSDDALLWNIDPENGQRGPDRSPAEHTGILGYRGVGITADGMGNLTGRRDDPSD